MNYYYKSIEIDKEEDIKNSVQERKAIFELVDMVKNIIDELLLKSEYYQKKLQVLSKNKFKIV